MREGEGLRSSLKLEDWLLLASISALPWCFGGVELWAYRSAAFLIVCAAVAASSREGPAAMGVRRENLWLLPALLLAGLAALQLVPLPPSLVKLASPGAFQAYERAFPGYPDEFPEDYVLALEESSLAKATRWLEVEEGGARQARFLDARLSPPGSWHGLSLEPGATADALLWYAALLAAFLLVRERVRSETRAHFYRLVLFALFAAIALEGLLQMFLPNGKLLWMRQPLAGGDLFGPYVNGTHFAGLMELGAPWLLGSFIEHARRSGWRGLRDARTVLPGLGALACATAAIATGSKAGSFLVVAAALCVFVFGSARSYRKWILVGAVVALAALAGLLYHTRVGEEYRELVRQVEGGISIGDRIVAWQACLDLFRAFPIFGCGFGAFGEVFAGFMPPGEPLAWGHAHNDYLEVLVEGGVIAFGLLAWLSIEYWRRAASRIGKAGPAHLGLVAGLAAISLHALLDFNHQVPGNALAFVTLAAIALPNRETASKGGARRLSRLSVGAVAVVAFAIFGVRGVVGGYAYARGARAAAEAQYLEAARLLPYAVVGKNAYPAAWLLGEVNLGLWDEKLREPSKSPEAAELRRIAGRAAESYARALWAAPAAGYPWDGLAGLYRRIEGFRRSQQPEDLSVVLADKPRRPGREGLVAMGLLLTAAEAEPNVYRHYDELFLMLWEDGFREKALSVLKKAAQAQPDYFVHEALRALALPEPVLRLFYEVSQEMVGRAPLLNRGRHLLSLARLAEQLGELGQAEKHYQEAASMAESRTRRCEVGYYLGRLLARAGRREEGEAWFAEAERCDVFLLPVLIERARFAEGEGRWGEALGYLYEARRRNPRDLHLTLEYARVAQAMGELEAAEEALRWATLVAPLDPRPYRRLIELHLSNADPAAAVEVFNRMVVRLGDSYEVEALRRSIERDYGLDLQQL